MYIIYKEIHLDKSEKISTFFCFLRNAPPLEKKLVQFAI